MKTKRGNDIHSVLSEIKSSVVSIREDLSNVMSDSDWGIKRLRIADEELRDLEKDIDFEMTGGDS